jgi:glycosyltransferase involved in cell wall biosynthesis
MISILLSTYNGSAWLPVLFESLLAQDRDDIIIVVRDDGSVDNTGEILSSYANTYDHVKLQSGPNIGVNRSFFTLLKSLPDETEYAAFCDQDDLWKTDKISRAVALLEERLEEGPTMYCSRLTIADEELNEISTTRIPPKGTSFANALVENIATGATMVMNRKAVDLLVANEPDHKRVVMYDWWIYQTMTALGSVFFDESSLIVSRQHRGNVVGLPFGKRYWKSKARFLGPDDRHLISTQVREFSRVFRDQLSAEDRERLDDFLTHVHAPDSISRWRFALSNRVFRQRPINNLFLKIRIMLGRI